MKSIQFIQWDRNHITHLQSLISCIVIVIVVSRLFVSKPVFITESITKSVFVSVTESISKSVTGSIFVFVFVFVSITVFVFVL